jgi:hypothetical protein
MDTWQAAVQFLLIDDRTQVLASGHPLTADGRCGRVRVGLHRRPADRRSYGCSRRPGAGLESVAAESSTDERSSPTEAAEPG